MTDWAYIGQRRAGELNAFADAVLVGEAFGLPNLRLSMARLAVQPQPELERLR